MVVVYHRNSKNEIDGFPSFRENITSEEIEELEKCNLLGSKIGTFHWAEFAPGSIEEFLYREWIECYIRNNEADIVRIKEEAIFLEKNSLNMYKGKIFGKNKE